MSELIHLIYASQETRMFQEKDILSLLVSAKANNEKNDITGMLLYDDGTFLQVLEGEADVVNQLFSKICEDNNHRSVVKILSEPISERSFDKWSMGYSILSRSELKKIDGMNDFFTDGKCLLDIDANKAKKILKAFAEGRWRLK